MESRNDAGLELILFIIISIVIYTGGHNRGDEDEGNSDEGSSRLRGQHKAKTPRLHLVHSVQSPLGPKGMKMKMKKMRKTAALPYSNTAARTRSGRTPPCRMSHWAEISSSGISRSRRISR